MLMSDDLVKLFKGLYKIGDVTTDNIIFKLHYRFSFFLLIAFSGIVTSNQLFFAPIKCTFSGSQTSWLPNGYLDNYCWIHDKITLPSAFDRRPGIDVAYAGVDNGTPLESKKLNHHYYQWTASLLFLQAMSFYFPRFLWRIFEGQKIKKILSDLNNPILKPKERETNIRQLASYLTESLGHHSGYGGVHVACEILNLVNVLCQLFATNAFLVGDFMSYGIEVIQYAHGPHDDTTTSPMDVMFPKDVKCKFHMYGASGSVTSYDALCILPVNTINEKIFLFLYFWYIILICLSIIALGYRGCLLQSRKLRWKTLAINNHYADRSTLQKLVMRMSYSDWFIIYILCKNMDTLHYRELVQELDEALYPNIAGTKLPYDKLTHTSKLNGEAINAVRMRQSSKLLRQQSVT